MTRNGPKTVEIKMNHSLWPYLDIVTVKSYKWQHIAVMRLENSTIHRKYVCLQKQPY